MADISKIPNIEGWFPMRAIQNQGPIQYHKNISKIKFQDYSYLTSSVHPKPAPSSLQNLKILYLVVSSGR